MNEQDRDRWRRLRDLLVFSGLFALGVWVLVPAWDREVAFFFLSVASSNFLPIPHEPILLEYAKIIHDPVVIGLISGVGAMVAGAVDYQAVGQVLSWEKSKSVTETRLFRGAVRGFSKAPFWTTWVFFLLPLPDYPIRVLAPASRMGRRTYVMAVGMGRAPRGWALAVLGHEFPFPWWALLVIGLSIVGLWAWPLIARRRGPRS